MRNPTDYIIIIIAAVCVITLTILTTMGIVSLEHTTAIVSSILAYFAGRAHQVLRK